MPLIHSDNVDQVHFHEASLVYTDAAGNNHAVIFDAVISEDWNPTATVTDHPVEDGANIADHVRVGLVTCSLKVHVTVEPSGSNWMADPTNTLGLLQIQVPTWFNNLDANTKLLQAAGLASDLVSILGSTIESATPVGNLVAQAMVPIRVVTADGNTVPGIDTSEALQVAGTAVSSLSDVASALTFQAIAENALPGYAVDVPVSVNVVQFGDFVDFASVMISQLSALMGSAQLFTVLGSKNSQANMILISMTSHRGDITETGTGAQLELQFKQVRIVSTNTVTAPIPALPRAQSPVTKGQQDPGNASSGASQSVLTWIVDKFGNRFQG